MYLKIIDIIKNKKGVILLVFGLVIGIILVMSDIKPNKNTTTQNTQNTDNYIENTELKLENLINEINGVSDTKVMINLKGGNGVAYIDSTSSKDGIPVIVDNRVVYAKEYLPEIEGVAIVCKGGNNAIIKEKITELVCSVLGLYSTHVYVTEWAEKSNKLIY